jgi:hypothetical protein
MDTSFLLNLVNLTNVENQRYVAERMTEKLCTKENVRFWVTRIINVEYDPHYLRGHA